MDFTPALNENSNQIENLQNFPDNRHDKESFKGAFGWVRIFQNYMVPYIIRVINGERIVFVSVQMVGKNANIQKYFNFFRPDILRCAIVKFKFMTHTEAKLFNEINILHYDDHYRKFSTNDCIIRYEDLSEFYEFTKFCYETCYHNTIPNEKYGFIQIDSFPVIPYIIIDSIKYTALLYFKTNGNVLQTIKITDWNFSYLKFCRKILGMVESLYSSDSYDVVSIGYIKRNFLPESSFKEFKLDYTKHILPLINNEPANALFNDRIEQRTGIVPATQNTTPHPSTTPVIPHNMSVITNGQEILANQMGLPAIQQGSNAINSKVISSQRTSPSPSTSTSFSRLRTRKGSRIHSEIINLQSSPSRSAPNNPEVKDFSELPQGSNAINKIVNSSQQPSPSPSTSKTLSSLGTIKGININNGVIDLTSSPPKQAANNQQVTLHLINTEIQSKRKNDQKLQGTSHNSVSQVLFENNQAGNSNKYNTLNHRQLPSPIPALPIINNRINSRINDTLGLPAINSKVISSQRTSPSPSTSTSFSRLRTRKGSRIHSEMINLQSSPSRSAPNNPEVKDFSELPQGSNAINKIVNSSQQPSPSPSTSKTLSSLGTIKGININNGVIDLTSSPPKQAANNQQVTLHLINTEIQSKRKNDQKLQGTSHNSVSQVLFKNNQAGNSNKYNTLNHRQLPSPIPALPIINNRINSRIVETYIGLPAINSKVISSQRTSPSPSTSTSFSRLRTRKGSRIHSEMINLQSSPSRTAPNNPEVKDFSELPQGSNAINKIVNSSQQPSPSPSTSKTLSSLGTIKGININNGVIDLTSSPPKQAANNQQVTLHLINTEIQSKRKNDQKLQGTSHNSVSQVLFENNQAGNSNKYNTLNHRQLPSPIPALPIINNRINSRINDTLGLPAINSKVISSQRTSPSPSTSTSFSRLRTRKGSRIHSEMINLQSSPSRTAPNNPEVKDFSELPQGSNAINKIVNSSQQPSPSPSTSKTLSSLGTIKGININNGVIDLTSSPPKQAANNQQVTLHLINTEIQSKRKNDQKLQGTSHNSVSQVLFENNQAGNSNKYNTLNHRQLPSPIPALPIINNRINSRINDTLGLPAINSKVISSQRTSPSPSTSTSFSRLRTRKGSRIHSEMINLQSSPSRSAPNNPEVKDFSELPQGSNAINKIVNSSQQPSPSPSTSKTLSSLGTIKGININNGVIDLTSSPPKQAANNQQVTLHLINTEIQSKRKNDQKLQGTSHNSVSQVLFENNQAGNSNKYNTLNHRQLPSPPPALPIINNRINSRINDTLGLPAIQQGSNAINSKVISSQRTSPSPSTSTSFSRLRTRKGSRIHSEMINLTSSSSRPAPNNQELNCFSELPQGSNAIYNIVNSSQQPSPSPSTSKALSSLGTIIGSNINNEVIDSASSPPSPAPNNQEVMGLSELQLGSIIMQDNVNIPLLSLPPTSTSLSLLTTERNSRIISEMINLTSPTTSPTPNNQSSLTLSTQLEVVYYPMVLDDEFEEIIYVTSINDTYRVNIVYNYRAD